jgi:hypothetical protein
MANSNNAGVARYQQEQAELRVAEKWDAVMGSPAATGREALARTLLAQHGQHEMSAAQIIAALEKAPAPAAVSETTVEQQMRADDPIIAAFGAPKGAPGGIFDPALYAAGAKSAKWLLNKE